MKVVIAKVDHVYFDGEAESLTVPGSEGEMTILSHHEPFVTTLKVGTVVVRGASVPGTQALFEIQNGILEVRAGGATIIL